MIIYVLGDLFTSPADVLVNTVNTVGVMGKGIAKDFKRYFPEMFKEYKRLCERSELEVGKFHFWRGPDKSVLNFPTKGHWRQKSNIEDIRKGLDAFVANYEQLSIRSIAFPQLGCGNGELKWDSQVQPLMEAELSGLPIDVFIHIYDRGDSFIEHNSPQELRAWLRAEPEALPFGEVWSDLVGNIVQLAGTNVVNGWNVSVRDSGVDGALILEHQQTKRQVSIEIELVRDIWNQLKSFGFVGADELPQPAIEPLLALLGSLEYIGPAIFQRTRLDERRPVQGIQLLPQRQKTASPRQKILI